MPASSICAASCHHDIVLVTSLSMPEAAVQHQHWRCALALKQPAAILTPKPHCACDSSTVSCLCHACACVLRLHVHCMLQEIATAVYAQQLHLCCHSPAAVATSPHLLTPSCLGTRCRPYTGSRDLDHSQAAPIHSTNYLAQGLLSGRKRTAGVGLLAPA